MIHSQDSEPAHKRKRDVDDTGGPSHADRIPQPPPPQSGECFFFFQSLLSVFAPNPRLFAMPKPP
jgi:hypothetical protein